MDMAIVKIKDAREVAMKIENERMIGRNSLEVDFVGLKTNLLH